ncbi:MAG: NADH-quinone oxidoreductase subunit C [Rhodobacteraceae bacterium]|nr:NADH-quinone oxidoreductase subunit C [Paracoccaceae bacterium]
MTSIEGKDLLERIATRQSDTVLRAEYQRDEMVVEAVTNALGDLFEFLRSDPQCRFSTLVDITAVDYPGRERRFEVVYHLLSMKHNCRLRIKVPILESEAVPSIMAIYPSANWFEREVFDMYGIKFTGHVDLRRLLTDYGFEGHPLRKDFPLTGYSEVRYDEVQKKVIYEPVNLVQEYRSFDFMSPWEGALAMNKRESAEDDG